MKQNISLIPGNKILRRYEIRVFSTAIGTTLKRCDKFLTWFHANSGANNEQNGLGLTSSWSQENESQINNIMKQYL